jgi:thymidine phosphorylase
MESLACLEGRGDSRLVELTIVLCELACELGGHPVDRGRLVSALRDGSAREAFLRWARAQGATAEWVAAPRLPLAPVEVIVAAPQAGVLAAVATRELGLLVQETSRDRAGRVDAGVALRYRARLGTRVDAGEELARLYLRREDAGLLERCRACFKVAEAGEAPPLVEARVDRTGR